MSAAKNILRTDNYGLPTVLTRIGLGDFTASRWFLALSLAFTGWVVFKFRRDPDLARDWSLLLLLAFSPMAWKANFGILLPVTYHLASSVVGGLRLSRICAWVGLVFVFMVSKDSPYYWGLDFNQSFGRVAGPLWLMAGAVAVSVWLRRRAGAVTPV